jgi:hypothetical protein
VVSQASRSGPGMPRLARRSCRVAVFALESKPPWPQRQSDWDEVERNHGPWVSVATCAQHVHAYLCEECVHDWSGTSTGRARRRRRCMISDKLRVIITCYLKEPRTLQGSRAVNEPEELCDPRAVTRMST